MTEEQASAISAASEGIRQSKARYFRGVDTFDSALVRSVLAEDCVLDYTGCFVDPATDIDYFPAFGIVLRGRDAWSEKGLSALGVVSVHQGHTCEITMRDDGSASVIWAMSDRLFMPPGGRYSQLRGFGHYHETYRASGGVWLIETLRISRIRVEGIG